MAITNDDVKLLKQLAMAANSGQLQFPVVKVVSLALLFRRQIAVAVFSCFNNSKPKVCASVACCTSLVKIDWPVPESICSTKALIMSSGSVWASSIHLRSESFRPF